MSTIAERLSTDMGVKGFIQRNLLLATYIIMFTIAWSIMIPQALYSQGMICTPLPETLENFTAWSAGIAVLIVSAV
jgi:hypothetical protein